MNVKKLHKRLLKVVEQQYRADGTLYVRIDRQVVDYDTDGNLITITGAYGQYSADGHNVMFQKDFELDIPDGMSMDFIAGMFYQQMIEADGNE